MSNKVINITSVSLAIFLVVFYLFRTLPFCYEVGGVCNAGVAFIFVVPFLIIVGGITEYNLYQITFRKSKIQAIVLSLICILLFGVIFSFIGIDVGFFLFLTPLLVTNIFALITGLILIKNDVA